HRQRGAAKVVDGAAFAAAEEGGAAAAGGLVATEGAGGDGGPAFVEQAAAEDVHGVGGGGGLVVAQGILVQGQGGTGLVEDAAPAVTGDRGATVVGPGDTAVGDGQASDGDGRTVADVEDPAGRVSVNGQDVGAEAFDGQVFADGQLAAAQGDGAREARLENDRGA